MKWFNNAKGTDSSAQMTAARILRNGDGSFGGVLAFIYADLIVLPILNIYRKYYAWIRFSNRKLLHTCCTLRCKLRVSAQLRSC